MPIHPPHVWHLVTGEYPPQPGGVSDYTRVLARALADAGYAVHVWCPGAHDAELHEEDVTVHRLAGGYVPTSLAKLGRQLDRLAGSRVLLVQYVPNAFGLKGLNIPFCLWLLWRAKRSGDDVRVMFHEPFFYFTVRRPWRNLLALVHRVMAAVLLTASRRTYVSIPAWRERLGPYRLRGREALEWLPIPSTVGRALHPELATPARPLTLGHFGTYGDHARCALGDCLPRVMRAVPGLHVRCIGRGGREFAATIAREYPDLASRISATGPLPPDDIAAELRACDALVQPYLDGVTSRRTTIMAALANGVPVVTTVGPLTEPAWVSSGAVSLVPARDIAALVAATEALLGDAALRHRLSERAPSFYEAQFSIERTLETLLHAVPA